MPYHPHQQSEPLAPTRVGVGIAPRQWRLLQQPTLYQAPSRLQNCTPGFSPRGKSGSGGYQLQGVRRKASEWIRHMVHTSLSLLLILAITKYLAVCITYCLLARLAISTR